VQLKATAVKRRKEREPMFNFGGKFRIDGDCRTIFMVEVKVDGCKWGTTPKIFLNSEEAEREAKILKQKYPFVSQCRVITRRIEQEIEKN